MITAIFMISLSLFVIYIIGFGLSYYIISEHYDGKGIEKIPLFMRIVPIFSVASLVIMFIVWLIYELISLFFSLIRGKKIESNMFP